MNEQNLVNLYFVIIVMSKYDFQAVNSWFSKKSFFKKVSIFEKKVLSWEKKGFLHWQFQILELKIGFALKKKRYFSSPISYTSSG